MKKIRSLLFYLVLIGKPYAQENTFFFNNLESSYTYSADIMANVNGGLETGIRYMDNIDVELGFEVKDFTFYFYGLGNQGKSISEIVGDIQAVSNIDTENSWRMYEAWIHKSMPKTRSSLLVGLYDLNSEFDVANTGGLFLNSSHGIGPDFSSGGITGPSIFPLTSLSARLKINPIHGVSFKIAVLDAVPSNPLNTLGTSVLITEQEGALFVSELSFSKYRDQKTELLKRGVNKDSPFRWVLGGWKYTKEREGWLGARESDHGMYSIVELIFPNGLAIFGRAGITNQDINRFNGYSGIGFTHHGLFKNRKKDQIGIALAKAYNSDDFVRTESLRGNDFSADELNIELTYLFVASENISFQLDTQYIQHPNQAPKIEDALVIGLRSVFGF